MKSENFQKKKSYQHITAALLSASTLVMGSHTYAVNSFFTDTPDTTFTLTSGDTLEATDTFSGYFYGIYGGSGSTNFNIQLGTGSTIHANSGSAAVATTGVYTRSNNTTLNAERLTVDVTGLDARGLMLLSPGGTATLGSGSSIKVNSTGNPSAAYALQVSGGSLTADALTIEAQGINTSGMYLSSAFNVNLGNNSSIHTTGVDGMGVNIVNPNSPSTFEANALTIQTDGIITGSGRASFNSSGDNAVSTIGAGSKIIANGSNAIKASSGSIVNFKGTEGQRNYIYSGQSDYGGAVLSSQAGTVINIENTDIEVNITGVSDNSGLWAQTGGIINGKNLNINMLQNGHAVMAYNPNGTVNLTGTNVITTASDQYYALYVAAGNMSATGKMTVTGNVNTDQGGTMNLTLDSASVITGDVSVVDNSTANLSMAAGSNLTGKTTLDPVGVLSLTLADSTWNVTDDSTLSTLALNNANVSFNQVNTAITTQDLSGNGTFNMQADIVGGTGNQLIVTGTSAGNHLLNVKANGSSATTGNEVLAMVQTADGNANFGMSNDVDLGGYRYGLRKNTNATDWELYSTGLTPTADRTLSFINTSYLLNYAETQTLLQRMGELRQSENTNGDVWVRAYTGKFDSFGGGQLSGFDMDYTGVQVGVDKRLNVNGATVYLGAMGGTSKADTHYTDGSGDITGYHVGLYGSYVMDNDFYIDGVLKYTHLKNSFNITASDKTRVNSDVNSDGYGISLEAGKRFYFDPSKSGYYIEPQAQLSYSRQGSASTTASDGLRVDMDSYDSTLGRVSAVVGYEVKNSQTPMNVYFKTGYVTEMSGKTSYSLNNNKENYDFGGDWWENSIGITAQLNKAHNLYLEGTYSSGSKFNQTQVNAGYRYSF